MYIVTNDLAAEGWEKVEEIVSETITRFDGEIVRMRKWGERHFAYPIQKETSGVYVLVHFKTDPSAIVKMENRVQLSAQILRVLITTLDEKYAEESFAKEPGEESAIRLEDSDYDDDDDFRRDRRSDRSSNRSDNSSSDDSEEDDSESGEGDEEESEEDAPKEEASSE